MSEINWKTPPEAQRRGAMKAWRPAVVELLKKRPGEWALVEERTAGSRATQWARLGCETQSRSVGRDGQGRALTDTYARWPE